ISEPKKPAKADTSMVTTTSKPIKLGSQINRSDIYLLRPKLGDAVKSQALSKSCPLAHYK
ncbi:MAG: hypothetical protein LM598_00005, partial [Candidatus Verstraetearchaeota archaeon]|nr:hypothetical protein [Candidatus Verstraetearchaeota archaeon]